MTTPSKETEHRTTPDVRRGAASFPASLVLAALAVLLPSVMAVGDDKTKASTAAAPSVDDLAWMAGTWVGERDGTTMEEHWTAPRGGLMLGLHRDVGSNGSAFFEYLRIERTDDGIFYMASPGGRSPATPFRLVGFDAARREVVFANPDHDFPQRITYRREGDVLHARAEAKGADGRTQALEWSWRRSP